MTKHTSLLLLLLCLGTALPAQQLLDTEIESIVSDLAAQVRQKMRGKNIAITDFIDSEGQPSALGARLAEEFSYALVNAAGSDFRVIDRSQLRKLLDEAGIGEKGMVDAQSVQRLGRLKGISAVVYGRLMPAGNYVRLFVKVIILEEMTNEITVRGDITRTQTIEDLLGTESKPASTLGGGGAAPRDTPPPAASSPPFTNQNIRVSLTGCIHRGSGTLDCELQVTSLGRDDNFSMQAAETVLVDAQGRSYRAQSLTMNNRTSTVQVNQPLRSDTAAPATVRFTGVPDSSRSFGQLNINCRSFSAYDFMARFANVRAR